MHPALEFRIVEDVMDIDGFEEDCELVGEEGERDDNDVMVIRNGAIFTPKTCKEVSCFSFRKGPEALHKQYTALVIDRTLLIYHLDTFAHVVQNGWSVIIPDSGKTT
jgi:hypothetical protein